MFNSTLKTKTPLKAKKPWVYKRTPLKTKTAFKGGSTLKKTRLKKVGKTGEANILARTMIAAHAEKKKMKTCELGDILKHYGIDVCTKTWPLAPAHRHKRAWYQGDPLLLADPAQWICACQSCHDSIEHSEELTEAVFAQLRGAEEL